MSQDALRFVRFLQALDFLFRKLDVYSGYDDY